MVFLPKIREKPVGTTELHYSTKKREHSFSLLKDFFVRHSSEYETSDNDRKEGELKYIARFGCT